MPQAFHKTRATDRSPHLSSGASTTAASPYD